MNQATHDAIWKAQGLCSACQVKGRDLFCPLCGRAFCAACIREHKHTLREQYLHRIWMGYGAAVPQDEIDEALALYGEPDEKGNET